MNRLSSLKNHLLLKRVPILIFLVGISAVFLTVFVLTRQITFIPLAAGTAELSLNPSAGTPLQTGQTVNVFVILNAKTHQLSAVDLTLFYDSSKLEVQDSDSQTAGIQIQPGNLFKTHLGNAVDPCGNAGGALQGKITLSGIAYDATQLPTPPPHNPFPGAGGNPVGTFATISFKAIAPGTASINFDFTAGATNDTNAVDVQAQEVLAKVTNTNFNVTGSAAGSPPKCPAVTPTPSATSVPTQTPSPTLGVSPTLTPTPTIGPSLTPSPSPTPILTPTPSLTPTPTTLACTRPDYDLDCDGVVCGRDASIFVSNFRGSPPYQCSAQRPNCNPDFNNDNIVNGADASVLMTNWSCR